MNKFELLNSIQAGPFTSQNKMIDFDVPASMIANLSETFVQLTVHLNLSNPSVLQNYILHNTTNGLNPFNVSLIRNCYITGEKVGIIEDIRRRNVIAQNLKELQMASSEKMSQIDALYQSPDYDNGMPLSPFIEFHKLGTVPSFYRDAKLRIDLKDLFSIGDIQALDTGLTGGLRIHLELENLDYLEVRQSKLFRIPAFEYEGQLSNVDITTSVVSTRPELVYQSLEESPYFVGQHLTLNYATNVPLSQTTQAVIITGIAFAPTTGVISLTMNWSFPEIVDPVTGYKNIFFTETTGTETSFIIETAELALCEIVGGKAPVMNAIQYTTFTTEEYTVNANNLNKIFEVEPNCINAFLMFDTNSSNLLSNNVGVKSYRLRLDGVDIYDRDIEVNKVSAEGSFFHDSLHYDAVNRTFVNGGLTLKNLSMCCMARSAIDPDLNNLSLTDRFDNPELQILVCATPTPVTALPKTLQYHITCKTPLIVIGNVILFKQVVKMIKL